MFTTSTQSVLQGRIEISGDVLGFKGLQFSADLNAVIWKKNEIVFNQVNQVGNVCDLGFCSDEGVLNLKGLKFKGDFNKAFDRKAKVVSTVPVPAAVWLFMSGVVGLFTFSKKRA